MLEQLGPEKSNPREENFRMTLEFKSQASSQSAIKAITVNIKFQ